MSSFLCVITPMEQLLDRQTERQADRQRGRGARNTLPLGLQQASKKVRERIVCLCARVYTFVQLYLVVCFASMRTYDLNMPALGALIHQLFVAVAHDSLEMGCRSQFFNHETQRVLTRRLRKMRCPSNLLRAQAWQVLATSRRIIGHVSIAQFFRASKTSRPVVMLQWEAFCDGCRPREAWKVVTGANEITLGLAVGFLKAQYLWLT